MNDSDNKFIKIVSNESLLISVGQKSKILIPNIIQEKLNKDRKEQNFYKDLLSEIYILINKNSQGTLQEEEKEFIEVYGLIKKFVNDKLKINNINFLFGNGISIYCNSETMKVDELVDELENKFKKQLKIEKCEFEKDCNFLFKKFIDEIKNLKIENIENLFDELWKLIDFLKTYHNNCAMLINDIIFTGENSLLFFWLNKAIGKIDYFKDKYIKLFLKKIFLNDNNINIFTLNYDLLIEGAADEELIDISNGFIGFFKRRFSLLEFDIKKYLEQNKQTKSIYNKINLIKLHGSISWEKDFKSNDILELQPVINKDDGSIENFQNFIKNASLIFPNKSKTINTLNSPFSELFRFFDMVLLRGENLLILLGYSGGDEHVNNLIFKALKNKNFNLLIFAYSGNKNFKKFEQYVEKNYDNITIIYSELICDFNFFVKDILINEDVDSGQELFIEKLKNIIKE